VAENFIYFNHAAIAPISMIVKEQINECMEKYCKNGIVCNREFLDIADHTRKMAAQLINAKPSEIAFVKNTTQGIQVAANGIRWQTGDNVLIPDNEFPANVFPWLNLAKRGVAVRFIPVKDGRFSAEDVARYVDKRTRAVSVSAVSFTNGFRCNLAEIGQLCKDKGIFFIVDAIQALGAMEVDVRKSKIDLLSADAHKWLLGPQGIGISYISDAMLENLDVSNLGYKSMTNEDDYLNYNVRPKSNASRFEEGTLNIIGIVGLKASLDMLLSIGIQTIEKRILELINVIIQNLTEFGYVMKSPMDCNERSGILSFYHNKISTDTISQNLFKAKVVCAQRDGAVRISPHFYNNIKDINCCLNALP
jgi:selenocysteine lyase/cysteine desulfurase